MRPKPAPDYRAGYPLDLAAQVRRLIGQDLLANMLPKYPLAHTVRNDIGLHDYVLAIKDGYLRNAGQLSKMAFDNMLHVIRNALGTRTSIARVRGQRLESKREIRIATVFREMPIDFLYMIVVHELGHLRQREHDKAFYQLCRHMEPDYHQLEFDLRAYLSHLAATGHPLWPPAAIGGWRRPASTLGTAPGVQPAPLPRAPGLVHGGLGFGYQHVPARALQEDPVCQNRGADLFRREADGRALTLGGVARDFLLDGEQTFCRLGLSLVAHAGHELQRVACQREAARLFANQAVRGEPDKRCGQIHVERNRAVKQVGCGHDLREFGRPPFRRKRRGHQKKYIHIVDRVHAMAFE